LQRFRVVEHDFGEERQPRAIGGGERVVRREFRFAGNEAHLALEFALDAVDAQGCGRPDLHLGAHRRRHVNARVRRAVG